MRRVRRARLLAPPFAVLALGAVAAGRACPQDRGGVEVRRVYDGDTIEALVDGRAERVRYIGIDTPERDDPRQPVREMAGIATAANRRLVEGRRVRLEYDVERRDRYGRLLAYVWVGDTLVNEVLAREGYAAARSFPPNLRHQERLRDAERQARDAGRNLWDGRLAGGALRLPPARPAADRVADALSDTGPGPRIGPFEAAEHIGVVATVCGRVESTRWLGEGGLTFLNLGRPYPDQPFAVVIPADARERFSGPPERTFLHREICVVGRIGAHRGAPQVLVEAPDRIRTD